MSDTWKRITGYMMLVSLLGLGGVYFKNMFGFSDMINKALANVPNLKDLTKLSKNDFDRLKPNINKNNNLPNKDSRNNRVTKINNNPYNGYQNREINRPNKINKNGGFKWKLGGRGMRFAKERKKLNRIFKKNEKELVKIIETDNMPSKNALNNGDAINESKGMHNILRRVDADHFENNKGKIRHSRKLEFDAKANKSNYGSNPDSVRDSDFASENDNVKAFIKNPLEPKTVSHEYPESIPILSDKSKRSADQTKSGLLQNEQDKVSKTNLGQRKHSSDHGAIGEDQNNALEGIFIDELVAKTLELVQNEQNMLKELYIPTLTANIYRFDSEDATNADFVQELQSLQRAHNANILAAGLFEQLHKGIPKKEVENAAASDSVNSFITNDKHPETGIKENLSPKKELKRPLGDVRTENQAYDLQQEKKQKIESELDDSNYDKIDDNKIKIKKGDKTEKKPVYGSNTKGDVVSQVGGLRHVRLRNYN